MINSDFQIDVMDEKEFRIWKFAIVDFDSDFSNINALLMNMIPGMMQNGFMQPGMVHPQQMVQPMMYTHQQPQFISYTPLNGVPGISVFFFYLKEFTR